MLSGAKGRFATVAVVTAVVAGLVADGAVAGTAPPSLTGSAVLCDNARGLVTGADGEPYAIRMPRWRGGPGRACVRTTGGAQFHVTRTPVSDGHVNSYPDVAMGCMQWTCTPDRRLPLRLQHVARLRSSLLIHGHPSGMWNASYDMWLGKAEFNADGSSTRSGAEVMVWPTYSESYAGHRIVHIAGRAWYYMHWHTCDHAKSPTRHGGVPRADVTCFKYISFRAVHQYRRVSNLNLLAFFRWLEDRQMVRKWWWLEGVEAGFEIWSGGRGLGISGFRVDVQKVARHKTRTYGHTHHRLHEHRKPVRHERHLRPAT
ncbi:MAG: hypothetical protein J2P17_09725 [Mycobacterium sp.]|nr:hypothetical protein [Mycobacterium sp.]